MKNIISVAIVALNEGKDIARAIKSLKWADEVVVCDMHSDDDTVDIARKAGAKVFEIEKVPYVELVRNLSISKATGDWILIMDPDEEIPVTLAVKLREIVQLDGSETFVNIPRKNLIFGKWVKGSMWWPDYKPRFFRKGSVRWGDKIHIPQETKGEGITLPDQEDYAFIHHHYDNVDQFVTRLNRYTGVQAKELVQQGYKFNWKDLIIKPLNEFMNRFFANNGYQDGLHGLVLSLLQAFSFLIVYVKVWEIEGFSEEDIELRELEELSSESGTELKYWFRFSKLSKNHLIRFFQKTRNKLL